MKIMIHLKSCLLLLALAFSVNKMMAYDFKSDELCYEICSITDGTVRVTFEKTSDTYVASYNSLPRKIEIPQTVSYNGRVWKVTQIGDYAFRGCRELQSVIIPEGIQSIGVLAFESCVSLSQLTLPSTLFLINYSAFLNCSGLFQIKSNADIPPLCFGSDVFALNLQANHPTGFCQVYVPGKSVTAYQHANGWKDLPIMAFSEDVTTTLYFAPLTNFPDKVTLIASQDKPYTGDIIIPETVYYNGRTCAVVAISDDTFANCTDINSVVIPDCIEHIGNRAFLNCKNLKSIKIPTNVSFIGTSAFKGCVNLATVDYFCNTGWSSGIGGETAIWENPPFSDCPSLRTVNIGNNVKRIPDDMFKGCYLEDIVIPDNVTEICADAFAENYDMRTITIGKNVTSMSNACFGNNNEKRQKIETVYYNAVKMQTYAGNQNKWYPFYQCKVKNLEIGEDVISLPSNAFNECKYLESVTVLAKNPPVCGSNCFTGVNKAGCVLKVPKASLSLYRNASVWKTFAVIEAIDEGIGNSLWYCTTENATNRNDVPFEISMNCTMDLVAFQCDVKLPNGMQITSIDGNLKIEKGDICSKKHFISATKLENGDYRIVCYSLDNSRFNVMDGSLFTIHLNCVDSNIGNNEIVISNIHLSDINSNDISVYPLYLNLDISQRSLIMGDTNGDEIVTITDAVNIVNYTLSKPIESFVEEVADVNDDGQINVSDAVGVINIVLNNDYTRQADRFIKSKSSDSGSNSMYIEDFAITNGEEKEMEIHLDNSDQITAFQMDLSLPDGIELLTQDGEYAIELSDRANKTHMISTSLRPNGDIRIICFSPNSSIINNNSGSLLSLKIETSNSLNKEVTISLHNIRCTTPDAKEIVLGDYFTKVNPISVLIPEIGSENEEVKFLNFQGVEVVNPKNGVYIKKKRNKVEKVFIK